MAQDASMRADADSVFVKVPVDLTVAPERVFGATYESAYDVVIDEKIVGRVVRRRSSSRTSSRGADRAARPWRALLLADGGWHDLDGWYATRIDAYVALRAERDAA